MIYIIIFLVANAIGVLAGFLIANSVFEKKVLKNVTGCIHLVKEDDESPPYIFLELEDKKEFEHVLKHDFVTLEVRR